MIYARIDIYDIGKYRLAFSSANKIIYRYVIRVIMLYVNINVTIYTYLFIYIYI